MHLGQVHLPLKTLEGLLLDVRCKPRSNYRSTAAQQLEK